MATEFFIRGNVPSLKNTKTVTHSKAIVSGPSVIRWQKLSAEDWLRQKEQFKKLIYHLPCPIFVHLTFIRNIDNLWDFTAPTETIADEMVKYNWINDDNRCEFVPCFGKPRIDKARPGTIIRVLKSPPIYTYL